MPDETLYGLTEGQVRRLGRVLDWYEREGKHLSARPPENAPPGDPIPMELARPTRTISSTLPSTATLPLRYHKVDSTGGTVPDTGSTVQGHDMTGGGASVFDRHAVSRHWQSGRQYAHPQRAPCSIVGGELHTMGVSKTTYLVWGGPSWQTNSSGGWWAKGGGWEIALITDPTTYVMSQSTDLTYRTIGGAWSLIQDIWVRDWALLSSTGLTANQTYRIFIYDSPTTYSTAGSTGWSPTPAWATAGWVSRLKLWAVPVGGTGSSNSSLRLRHGAPVMLNDARKRYIGTVTLSTDGLFENSKKNRLVCNFYNPRHKEVAASVPAGVFGDTGNDTALANSAQIRVTHDLGAEYELGLHYHALIEEPASTESLATKQMQVSLAGAGVGSQPTAYGAGIASNIAYRYPLNLSLSQNVRATAPGVNTYRFKLASYAAGTEVVAGFVEGLVEC